MSSLVSPARRPSRRGRTVRGLGSTVDTPARPASGVDARALALVDPSVRVARPWRPVRPVGGLPVADLAAAALGGSAITHGPGLLPLALGWVLLIRAATPVAARLGRPSLTALWRAVSLVAIGCWVLGDRLSVPAGDLMLALAVTATGSALARAAVGGRRLRVLLVGTDRDRALAALAPAGLGRVRAVDSCEPEAGQVAARLAALRRGALDAVLVVPGPDTGGRILQRLAWEAEAGAVPLLVATGIEGVTASRLAPLVAGDLGMVHVRPAPRRGWRSLVKQVVDRSLAALVLVVFAPLMAGIAVAIRLDSPGPVLFRQQRVGRGGRTFTMLKFRSMTQDAEQARAAICEANEGAGPLFKLRADPRVTRVGRFLRRYSLDELPQLVNVIRGEMSLVGPRPALPAEVAQYDGDPRRRLAVTPGITGLWQVSGRSELSWSESVRLDLDYVDNWSLLRDLAILGRTVRAVLRHHGAY